MPKVSIKAAARDALRDEKQTLKALAKPVTLPPDGTQSRAATHDSFNNFAHKLGVGADNPLSTASYGFNPITRNRTQLEWIHRGSWLGGVSIDVIADDMTRAGIEFNGEMEPGDLETLDNESLALGVWAATNEAIKWGRLYGGAIAIMLIDGQDFSTPLNPDAIGKDQFKGLLVLDRWQCEPALEDLVTDLGPDLGLPKFYRVGTNAPALRNQTVHYSRVAFRPIGVQLPYHQRLTESLWGVSVLERLWDRMIAYDSASTGAAQLVYKAYLRTLSIDGMREIVSMGGPALDGLVRYTDMMRRYQNIEGITLIDAKDTFETQEHGAMTGISDALNSFAEQLSGALQIPLTRLFGQSPKGFSEGDNDVRNYFDGIKQKQMSVLHNGMTRIYKAMALSKGIKLPDNFGVAFRSLWQLTDVDKSTIAKTNTDTITAARDGGLISDQTALQELRQQARITGIFTNITQELVNSAEADIPVPIPEGHDLDPETGEPVPQAAVTMKMEQQRADNEARSQPTPPKVGGSKSRRSAVR